jgi:hypothetical protein
MKSRNLKIALAVAALIPLGVAVAGDQYGSKSDKTAGESFKKLDTNKDGRISQAEAAVDSTIVFSTADVNGDGYLDSDEWKAAAKGSNKPQSQSQDSSAPSSEMPQGTPPADTTTPTPDTETPRQ